jgi:hypothetical protein
MDRTRIGSIAVFAAALIGLHSPILRAGPIEDLAPGHWYRVPNSKLSAVLPSPLPPGDGRPGRAESIIDEWSSGAFDTRRDRLIVWGGGHNNYSGNELYAFDLNTLQWQRLTNPSADVGGVESSGYYPDGPPRSRHTYEYLEYVPSIDRFCSFGGAAQYPSGSYENETANVDCFNFGTNQWETRFYKSVPRLRWESLVNGLSAYDPVTDRIYLHTTPVGDGPGLYRWRPATNGTDAWEILQRPAGYIGGEEMMTAEIDPERRVMVAAGAGNFLVWDLNNPDAGYTRPTPTGDTQIRNVLAPGLAYDPVSKGIVAWSGGADVYALTRSGSTWVWTRRPAAATNAVVPPAATATGMYGRFRYSPAKNVFVVVTAISQDVYVYKLAPGGGTPASPTLQFSAATSSVGEAAGSASIGVTRTGSASGAVSVTYETTTGGSAIAGADYTAVSGQLSWADGDTQTKTFSVPITNDTSVESNETVWLRLLSPTGGAVLGPQSTSVVTILDDDGPSTIQLGAATYAVNEGAGGLSITVTRSGNAAGSASVSYATRAGTALAGADFTHASGSLTWGDGQLGARTFSVPIINDTDVEGSETFTVELSNAAGAVLGSPTTATVTITDNDGAPVSPPPAPAARGGCSLGRGGDVDPMLLLLVAIAFGRIARQARHNRTNLMERADNGLC